MEILVVSVGTPIDLQARLVSLQKHHCDKAGATAVVSVKVYLII